MFGAGIGGALGGATGAGLGAAGIPGAGGAAGLTPIENWLSALANQFLSGVPGYVGTTVGWSEGK